MAYYSIITTYLQIWFHTTCSDEERSPSRSVGAEAGRDGNHPADRVKNRVNIINDCVES